MTTSITSELRYLTRPDGRLAYSVMGAGPLIVAVPGMGDLRDSYRELTGPLVEAGFRVAVMDLGGHGDSDTSFRRFGDQVAADDILALIAELGGPAVVMGTSMAGSAALLADADRPDAVAGLVLLSPFLREGSSRAALALARILFRVMFASPWGAAMWANYYRKTLNRGTAAAWLGEHAAAIATSMREPGRLRSFRELAIQLDHRGVETRLPEVTAPSLTIMGSRDPDYRDPAAELAFAARALGGETVLVDDVAHYPHAARPEIVTPRVLDFVGGLRSGREWRVTVAATCQAPRA
ncbi:MAG: alpha/beta hydrolase [Pseudolysinimonas sp.]